MSGSGRFDKHLQWGVLIVVAAFGLWWAELVGYFGVGEPLFRVLVATAPVLVILWLVFAGFKKLGVAGKRSFQFVVAISIVMLLLAYQPWTPRATFVKTLHSIKPGMNKQEVEVRMARYKFYDGSKTLGNSLMMDEEEWNGSPTGAVYYRWNETDSRYDFDLGEVVFEDGVVVSRRFLPD